MSSAHGEHSPEGITAPLSLSIVVCTWNRVDMLVDTLRSISACARDGSFEMELIVVDNASTDGTAEALGRLGNELSFASVHEPKPGLSNARNTGVDHAHGEWVLFLDDDVLVPHDFLVNYVRAIRSLPEVAFIAGGVIPHFDEVVPSWVDALCEEQWWCFSALVLPTSTRELTSVQTPFGANMAVRRDVLLRFRFADAFGFRHGVLVPGEETELFTRIRAAGHRGYWVDDVSLRHRLPAQRWRLSYLLKRAFGQGMADAERAKGELARFPFWVPKDILVSLSATAARAAVRRPTWACSLIQAARGSGHLQRLLLDRLRSRRASLVRA